MVILGADKKAAIANAKLKVFEDTLSEEDLERSSKFPKLRQSNALHPYPCEIHFAMSVNMIH